MWDLLDSDIVNEMCGLPSELCLSLGIEAFVFLIGIERVAGLHPALLDSSEFTQD